MFTSRAEYRILLRQDDADMRLTPIGYEIGLADDERYEAMLSKKQQRDALMEFCESFLVKSGEEINAYLESIGSAPLTAGTRLVELIKRPHVSIETIAEVLPSVARYLEKIESGRRSEIIEAAEILIKYGGYIARERELADKQQRLEYVRIPENMNFSEINALSTEARQKLERHRPSTIGQASRIPGVSPADVNVLLLLLRK